MKPAVAFLSAVAFLAFSIPSHAQAPANAPAGANGICKDGTYSTAAAKSGACRGHKGVQTWYRAEVPAASVPAPGKTAVAPAPTPKSATASLPAPIPANAPSLPSAVPAGNTAVRPVPAPVSGTPARPVPSPATSTPAMPAPGQSGTRSNIATERSRLKEGPAAPGGGPGLVWVNTSSKVYHCPGTDFYGKTKAGSYMPEAEAKQQGARPDHNKPCS